MASDFTTASGPVNPMSEPTQLHSSFNEPIADENSRRARREQREQEVRSERFDEMVTRSAEAQRRAEESTNASASENDKSTSSPKPAPRHLPKPGPGLRTQGGALNPPESRN